MKSLIKSFCFAVLFIQAGYILAQNSGYTVITKSGKVTLIDRLNKNPKQINIGDKLSNDDKIEVDYGGYIVFVDTSMQSIELKSKGVYSLSDVSKFSPIKRNSIMENITKFILAEMSSSDSKYKEMKTLGAVVRKPLNKIDVSVPHTSALIDSLYTFSWHPLKPQKTDFILRIFNEAGNTLFMQELSDTSITMELSKFNLNYGQDYYWTVFERTATDPAADSISFRLLSPQEELNIKNDLKIMRNDYRSDDSPYNYYLTAKYLSNKGLNIQAMQYFDKIIKLNSDSEFYWYEYLKFLMDIGLERKAINEWEMSPFNIKKSDQNIEN